MDDNQQLESEKDKQIRYLKSAVYMIAGMHMPISDAEDAECVYCGTKFPCFTVRVARRAATYWSNG